MWASSTADAPITRCIKAASTAMLSVLTVRIGLGTPSVLGVGSCYGEGTPSQGTRDNHSPPMANRPCFLRYILE